jgi:hypothetical protein
MHGQEKATPTGFPSKNVIFSTEKRNPASGAYNRVALTLIKQ